MRARWLVMVGCLGAAACPDNPRPPDQRVDAGSEAGEARPDLPQSCSLRVATVNGRPLANVTALGGGDDLTDTQPGLQIDVEITGTALRDGTDVALSVTGLGTELAARAQSGRALFAGVTVLSHLRVVVLRASAPGCAGDSVELPVQPPPECTFLAPLDGHTLGKTSDKNPATLTFEFDVAVATKNAEGGQVVLYIGAAAQAARQPDENGNVVYPDSVLPEGNVVLKAEVTAGSVKRSCLAEVTVSTGAPACNLLGLKPEPLSMTGGGQGLGKKQDADVATAGVETNIEVQSDAGNSISLLIDGLVHNTLVAGSGLARFEKVPLSDGTRLVSAACAHPGTGAMTYSQSASLLVDSVPPLAVDDLACSVASNRQGKISCSWTARADNAGGSGVETILFRYLTDTPLAEVTWDSATTLPPVAPGGPGSPRTEVFEGLPLGHTFYLGLKVVDKVGNSSGLALAVALLIDFKSQERTLPAAEAVAVGGVSATGDFNCDGLTDVAVGQPALEGDTGKVYMYLGTSNGLLAAPEKVLRGTIAGARFGEALAALPNFDADGDKCHDLAVLASYQGGNQSRVYLYLGRKYFFDRTDLEPGTGAELVLRLDAGAPATQRLGPALASAGDFDADGATDLQIGFADSSVSAAWVLVVHGVKGLALMRGSAAPVTVYLAKGAGVTVGPGELSESFGLSLGEGAQIDSDPYADLMIGAPAALVSGAKRGTAYLVKGGARAATLPEPIALDSPRVLAIRGAAGNGALGTSLGFVGDMNKDGKREFAVGDPLAAGTAGAVYLFNAASNPASATDAVAVVANDLAASTGNGLGAVIAGAGNVDPLSGSDFNADTYSDLVAGATATGAAGGVGAAFLLKGALGALSGLSTGKAAYVWSGPTAAPSFARVVVLARDINGDGYLDLVIGDPQAASGKGRFFVFY